VIEKHFTLRRADGGVDSAFSLEPEELAALVTESERAHLSLGTVNYTLSEKEQRNLQFKRSLYFVKNLRSGEEITAEHVRSIRPSTGLHTRYYEDIIGKKVATDVTAGSPVTWNAILNEQ
jgi:N-acetylneuraminate synthase